MKRLLVLLIASSALFIGACSQAEAEDVITDPCDPEFIGPVEDGQCD